MSKPVRAAAVEGEDLPAGDAGVGEEVAGIVAPAAGIVLGVEDELRGAVGGILHDAASGHGGGFGEGQRRNALIVHVAIAAGVAVGFLMGEEVGEGAADVVLVGAGLVGGVAGGEIAEDGEAGEGVVVGIGGSLAGFVEDFGPVAVGLLGAGEVDQGAGDGGFGFGGAAVLLELFLALIEAALWEEVRFCRRGWVGDRAWRGGGGGDGGGWQGRAAGRCRSRGRRVCRCRSRWRCRGW